MPVEFSRSIGLAMFRQARKVADALGSDARREIIQFILSQQNDDGGFRGRSNRSDVYYSFFALACLLVLNEPPPQTVAAYLEQLDRTELDLVHLSCLVRSKAILQFSRMPDFVQKLNPSLLRRGAAFVADSELVERLAGEMPRDLYHAFLLCQALEDVGREPAQAQLVPFIEECRAADGAYAKCPGLTHGTATCTAAAVLLQQRLGQTTPENLPDWVRRQQLPGGGFRASPLAPLPDLLSTATALTALKALDEAPSDAAACLDFVESNWTGAGGFCGSAVDSRSDCEYTFYGLLALSCLLP